MIFNIGLINIGINDKNFLIRLKAAEKLTAHSIAEDIFTEIAIRDNFTRENIAGISAVDKLTNQL